VAWVVAGLALPLCVESQFDVAVDWRVNVDSTATDESCNKICENLALSCTEKCWPRTQQGLQQLQYGSNMQSICFGVASGENALWHPAKDPVTRVCYHNTGTVTAPRCPEVPVTPLASQYRGYIRRICPCLARGVSRYASIDCGLGVNPADPAPEPAGQQQFTPPPIPSYSPTAPPTDPTATEYSGGYNASSANWTTSTLPPVRISTTRPACTRLCVSGFGLNDETLNGEYIRTAFDDGFKRWSKAGSAGREIGLAKVDGGRRWQFSEMASGGSFSLAQGTMGVASPTGPEMPADETFITATSEDDVAFKCCISTSGGSSSNGALYGNDDYDNYRASSPSSDAAEEESSGFGLVVALVCVAVACIGALVGTAHRIYQQRKMQRQMEAVKSPEFTTSSPPRSPSARRQSDQEQRGGTWARRQPGWDNGGGAGDGYDDPEEPFVNAFKGAWRNRSGLPEDDMKKATTCPSGFGREDSDVADMLGRAAPVDAGHGHYEGPLRPWWGGTSKAKPSTQTARSSATTVGFSNVWDKPTEGTEVRLRNIVENPTWNGEEGIVIGYDGGRIEVEFDDGRTKSVLVEQCEVIGTPPAEAAEEEPPSQQVRTRSSSQTPDWRAPPPGAHVYGSPFAVAAQFYGSPAAVSAQATPQKSRFFNKVQPPSPKLTRENVARHEEYKDIRQRADGLNTGPPRLASGNSATPPPPPPPPLPPSAQQQVAAQQQAAATQSGGRSPLKSYPSVPQGAVGKASGASLGASPSSASRPRLPPPPALDESIASIADISAKASQFPPGAAVVVRDLKNAAHLNGQDGTCERWDDEIGRWVVRFKDGESKSLLPDNLEANLIVGSKVRLNAEGKSAPQGYDWSEDALAPGVVGTLIGFSHDGLPRVSGQHGNVEEYWRKHIEIIQEADSRFQPGTPVVAHGLKSAPHLNGQDGICERWDLEGGRCIVLFPDGESKALLPANLKAAHQPAATPAKLPGAPISPAGPPLRRATSSGAGLGDTLGTQKSASRFASDQGLAAATSKVPLTPSKLPSRPSTGAGFGSQTPSADQQGLSDDLQHALRSNQMQLNALKARLAHAG